MSSSVPRSAAGASSSRCSSDNLELGASRAVTRSVGRRCESRRCAGAAQAQQRQRNPAPRATASLRFFLLSSPPPTFPRLFSRTCTGSTWLETTRACAPARPAQRTASRWPASHAFLQPLPRRRQAGQRQRAAACGLRQWRRWSPSARGCMKPRPTLPACTPLPPGTAALGSRRCCVGRSWQTAAPREGDHPSRWKPGWCTRCREA